MARLNIVQAVNDALACAMQQDQRVLVMGQDVGVTGGVFRATDGLYEQFGADRCIDTPLAESAIIGTGIGMAAYGLRPVVEIQFDGFMPPAFDQIVSHAARLRNRTRGRFTCPMVIRAPYAGGVRAPEHHSESPEAWFAHVPGLKVVIPATPYDAKGLLMAAIADPDPVIFLEPKSVYRAFRQEVPAEAYTVPIGQAQVVQEGSDLTLIAWGAMLQVAQQAAQALTAETGYSIEIIDLRTIAPVDRDTIINSVAKTGRCVIVHEAPRQGGFGAELVALINEHAFFHLEAPVARVCGFDVPTPFFAREGFNLPTPARARAAIEQVLAV